MATESKSSDQPVNDIESTPVSDNTEPSPSLIAAATEFCLRKLISLFASEKVRYVGDDQEAANRRVAEAYVEAHPEIVRVVALGLEEGVTYDFHAIECKFGYEVYVAFCRDVVPSLRGPGHEGYVRARCQYLRAAREIALMHAKHFADEARELKAALAAEEADLAKSGAPS